MVTVPLNRSRGQVVVTDHVVRGVQQQMEQGVRMHVRCPRSHLDGEQKQPKQGQQAQRTGGAEVRDGAWQGQLMLGHGGSQRARFTTALYHPVGISTPRKNHCR